MFILKNSSMELPQLTSSGLILGRSGSGKSSLVNLLTGTQIAETSDSALPVTQLCSKYQVKLKNMEFTLTDTCSKISNMLLYLRDNNCQYNFIIYCITKGRLSMDDSDLFNIIQECIGNVPILLVVTDAGDAGLTKNKNYLLYVSKSRDICRINVNEPEIDATNVLIDKIINLSNGPMFRLCKDLIWLDREIIISSSDSNTYISDKDNYLHLQSQPMRYKIRLCKNDLVLLCADTTLLITDSEGNTCLYETYNSYVYRSKLSDDDEYKWKITKSQKKESIIKSTDNVHIGNVKWKNNYWNFDEGHYITCTDKLSKWKIQNI